MFSSCYSKIISCAADNIPIHENEHFLSDKYNIKPQLGLIVTFINPISFAMFYYAKSLSRELFESFRFKILIALSE